MRAGDIMFSPSVKKAQSERGSRTVYARVESSRGFPKEVDEALAAFIAERESFYLATASAGGRPYIQHRGGPKGFLKVLDANTLAFADYGGNKQYISVGNLDENDQAFLFLMDYPNRARIKIWGRAEIIEDDPSLLKELSDPAYPARLERVIRFTVEAWDANCAQHIQPRYTVEEMTSLPELVASLATEHAGE